MISKAHLLLLLLLLLRPLPPVAAAPFAQWRILFSLSNSLMRRVATARAARGDLLGADRATKIAEKLDGGLSFWSGIASMSWDYIKHYAWRDFLSNWPPREVFGAMSDINQLIGALNDLVRMDSDVDRARWVAGNYRRVSGSVMSLLRKLLVVFSRSGPLREVVLILRQEAEEGGLIRDCLEVGANDLKGLIEVAMGLASQYLFDGSREGQQSDDEL